MFRSSTTGVARDFASPDVTPRKWCEFFAIFSLAGIPAICRVQTLIGFHFFDLKKKSKLDSRKPIL